MAEEPKKDDGPITMGTIRSLITEVVTEATRGLTGSREDKSTKDEPSRPGGAAGRTQGVQEAVQAEIEKIKAREAAAERDKTIDEQLAALADKTAEKPPVERSRRHKLMGWGE
jgi:hypothetical protein